LTKKPNVPADAIDKSKPETAGPAGPVGNDPLNRDPIIDQKMGAVGKVLGFGDEKKANIAALSGGAFFILLVFCIITYIWSSNDENRTLVSGLLTPIFGVITGAIGYITGRKK
jgi:hypothetical protein